MNKWSAMVAQTKTAGGAATPEPLQNAKAESLTVADFLAALLPDQGHYCLFLLPEARHVWTDSIVGLAALVEKHKDRHGVYYAPESFKTEARSQSNVRGLKALRLDIDAGQKKHDKDPHGTYATQHDARHPAPHHWRRHAATCARSSRTGLATHPAPRPRKTHHAVATAR